MVMRGAAPSCACPRCGTEAVPTGEKLLHCRSCQLAFDPNPDRPPVSPPAPDSTHDDDLAPSWVELARTGDRLSLTWGTDRAVGLAVCGFGVLLGAVVTRGIVVDPAWRGGAAIGVGAVVAGAILLGLIMMIGRSTVVVDNALVRRLGGPLARRTEIRRGEIKSITVELWPRGHEVVVWGFTAAAAITLARFGGPSSAARARYLAETLAREIGLVREVAS